jgi:hypothetical protein
MRWLQPNLMFSWQLNPKTQTQVKGYTLPSFQFLFFVFLNPIFTSFGPVFNQGIIQGDTLRVLDQDV